MTDSEVTVHQAWWCIHSEALMDALTRAHQGEDPEQVYIELYANSTSGDPDDE